MEKAAVPPSEESTAQRKPSWRGTLDDIWMVKKKKKGCLEGGRKRQQGEDHLSVRRRTVTRRLPDGTASDCLGRAKFSSQGGARLGRSQSAGSGMYYRTWVVPRWVPETADGVR
ncbi:uncharacterized protein BO80DRAFT_457543 [Aspergillus ibericus CBS 121593]|uniref:Uncharacterized protein n=1 Tax=Aspergillus ibericus CBS 121593 TaxID=1448316 RepID=A0A395GSU6_9EURO|nr:hypothetical protein BO80DRAFT_457543 [Aspergillus ibericus CBS 121593]RAK98264.1 hypothetical protein BO80DRAFT_457543 [Aspergillus ibericus CBS 121593]